jgi:diaminopimelate decarboxylase
MTINFPTFYEYHFVLSCRQPFRDPVAPVDVIGSGCYSADFVCRNLPLPPMQVGDLLAVMDAGAYFLSFEGNFSVPRAAVIAVRDGRATVYRRAESCDDMLRREQAVLQAAS